jgi:hypothetical protein
MHFKVPFAATIDRVTGLVEHGKKEELKFNNLPNARGNTTKFWQIEFPSDHD